MAANPKGYQQLADEISELVEGHALDDAATALTVNLATTIAGYPPRSRTAATEQTVSLLLRRVEQLEQAGIACTSNTH